MPNWLGVDTGGTFTDFVLFDGNTVNVHKVLSTPSEPQKAILQGIKELGLDSNDLQLVHGSTVATNAVLEGKGVNTVYIANRGLKDVITIGRQARQHLYELQPQKPALLIKPENCLEVPARISADGDVLQSLTQQDLDELAEKIKQLSPDAVAINLLFSYLDDSHEKQIEAVIPESVFVSRSSAVLNEYREYERGMATCLNAYVGPLMQKYLSRLEQGLPGAGIAIMQSNGGTISVEQAGKTAVNLLLSGPAGGLRGAWFAAANQGERALLSFDMGGTSTDVAMINGEIELTSEGHIAGFPVSVPMIDMHTIGAGGGSIAQVDAGGMLLVGPESAGATPGPACYGQGGSRATVTDANFILGRIPASQKLGGDLALDANAAQLAIAEIAEALQLDIEQAALGILRIANEHMAQALRVMSVQRGYDPADFSLVSFGGAGGLHVCDLAELLNMSSAIIPVHGGVLSALGMLVAPASREKSHTINTLLSDCDAAYINQSFSELEQRALEEMKTELQGRKPGIRRTVDVRYQGQSFTLAINWDSLQNLEQQFHLLHQQRYGHQMKIPLELVNLRVHVSAASSAFSLPELAASTVDDQGLLEYVRLAGINSDVPVYAREQLGYQQKINGPALIIETTATSYIKPGWQCEVEQQGNLLLRKTSL